MPGLKRIAQQAVRRSGRMLSCNNTSRILNDWIAPHQGSRRHATVNIWRHLANKVLSRQLRQRPDSVDVIEHGTVMETQLSGSGDLLTARLAARRYITSFNYFQSTQ